MVRVIARWGSKYEALPGSQRGRCLKLAGPNMAAFLDVPVNKPKEQVPTPKPPCPGKMRVLLKLARSEMCVWVKLVTNDS